MPTKIIISPSNKKAIAFFEQINKKKEQIKKDVACSPLVLKLKQRDLK